MNVNQIIGAGLRDAKIRNAAGDIFDIHGIVSLGGDPNRETIEVTGDDRILGNFTMSMSNSLSIEANSLTFDVIQAITGNAVSSSATGASVALGTDSEMNPPVVEVIGYVTAKSEDGTAAYIEVTYHKVQLMNVNVAMEGGSEFKFSSEGVAYQTETDVEGASLPSRRIMTIAVKAGNLTA